MKRLSGPEIREFVSAYERRVTQEGLPPEAAIFAGDATRRAARRGGAWTATSLSRYFDKVASRRLVRRHGDTTAAARLVADCVVADMVEAGRTPADAYWELARGWVGRLPSEVIAEYREKLCA